MWKNFPLTTDRHCCHAIVFKFAPEQETDQILDDAAKIRSASAATKCWHPLARHLHYVEPPDVSTTMYILVILHCEELGRQGGQIHPPPSITKKKNLLRPRYNTPILQTSQFCSESNKNRRDSRINFPHKQQAPSADNTRVHFMNHYSIVINLLQRSTSSNMLYCINHNLCCLSLSC